MIATLPAPDSRFARLSTARLARMLTRLATREPGSPEWNAARIELGWRMVSEDDVRRELRARERFGTKRAALPTVDIHWHGPLGLPVVWRGRIEYEDDERVRIAVEAARVGPKEIAKWEPVGAVFTTQRRHVLAVEPVR